MFVYLLIVAELAVLYIVFWYLWIRDPKTHRQINGGLWGSYDDNGNTIPSADPLLQYVEARDDYGYHPHQKPQYVEEMILDARTNRYVAKPSHDGRSLLERLAVTLDEKFSRLNVKP